MSANLASIECFQSMSEFLRFEYWISQQISEGAAVEVEVGNYYAGVNFKERWFKFETIAQVWRLVYPDGPFRGYWGQVILK